MFVHRLKLRPPQPLPTWIDRPAIERRFRAGISVFSIVAGPGYGKTVLAAQLFERWDGPKLWYSLDSSDADLAVFAVHLDAMVGALELRPDFEGESWRLWSPKEVGAQFAELLADLKPSPLLVFDDVHLLEDSRSLIALGEFVERLTRTGAAFVLCGRSMPLPLHTIAATARLGSAAASDLVFNEVESRAYLLRTTELQDEAVLVRLMRRTEGWPAGLALIASTAGAGDRDAARNLSEPRDDTSRQLLFDYLAAEALGGLAERERRFLLETAILDELETQLCDAVTQTSGSADLLASFARRGLFVTRRSEDAYTCHVLFREFLRHRLERTVGPEAVAQLHRHAAAAFLRRGDRAGSIAHLLDAGDLDAASAALEASAFALLGGGLIERVGTFLRRVGTERIESSPTLLVALGRVQHLRGEWDQALASLERGVLGAREREQYDILAEAVRLSSPILASRGEFERLHALLEQTLALGSRLSETSVTALRMTLGAWYLDHDRFDEALEIFREIVPSLVARGDLALQGMVLHNTAVALVRRGDPYAGLAMYERALKVKRSAGQLVSSLVSLASQIFALRIVGDLDEAERATGTLLVDARDIGNAGLLGAAYESDGALRLARGDLEGAARAYRQAQQVCDPGDVLVLPDILHRLARCELETGNVAAADELCTKAIAILRGARRRQQVAPVLVTRAECACARGDSGGALAQLRNAIASAGEGPDSVLEAATNLDAAALLVRLVPRLREKGALEAEASAAATATRAIALVHERDYRFLLRTRSRAFADLREHLRRWRVGGGLVPEVPDADATLRIEMLGGLRVLVNGEVLLAEAWKRRRARDIFAYLVSLRGRPVTRSRLVDLYWPETDADAGHDNLRVTISAIRKAVGDLVKFEANGYRFVAPPGTIVDTEVFGEQVESARQAVARGDQNEARRAYLAASELYRGDFLEGIEDGGWQWRERERLRAACLEALRWLASDRAGDRSVCRLALDRLLEIAPFDVEAVRMRLGLLADELRLAEAKRDYEEWRVRYRAAVGADPPDIWAPVLLPIAAQSVPSGVGLGTSG